MSQPLAHLKALQAFEAAARHLSFKKAADELHVTPAAISLQVKTLEDSLDVRLFHRLNRALQLTEVAQVCLPKLQEGFACLAKSIDQVRTYHINNNTLTLWIGPTLAVKWLVPRLNRFAALHPPITMRILSSVVLIDTHDEVRLEDFQANNVNVAIWIGRGNYPGFRVDKLLSVEVVPLCSPRLLTGAHPLRRPEDLQHHILLHDETLYLDGWHWRKWLQVVGVKGVDTSGGPHFDNTVLALRAALEGQGVLLSLRTLVAEDLAAGRLVIPFDLSVPLDFAYYLVCPEATAEQPKIAAFRQWLLTKARRQEQSRGSVAEVAGCSATPENEKSPDIFTLKVCDAAS